MTVKQGGRQAENGSKQRLENDLEQLKQQIGEDNEIIFGGERTC